MFYRKNGQIYAQYILDKQKNQKKRVNKFQLIRKKNTSHIVDYQIKL